MGISLRTAVGALVVGLVLEGSASAATITLVHVNDTHSHLDAVGPRDASLEGTIGGLWKAATVFAEIRKDEPDAILLHAGDAFTGDLYFNRYLGAAELGLLQQLGFTAMAVGNHEFDLGPRKLAEVLTSVFGTPSTALPLLSANIDASAVPRLAQFIQPSILRDVGGVRVGIFGMTTPPDAATQNLPVVIHGGGDPSVLYGIAEDRVSALRSEGAELVICLSHLGSRLDLALAGSVAGIHVIVGGHDHYEFSQPIAVTNPGGATTLVVQAGEHYKKVGRMRLAVEGDAVSLVDYALIPVDGSVPRADALRSDMMGLRAGVEQAWGDVFHMVLAHAEGDITPTWNPAQRNRDTPLGNLIADAYRRRTGTDIAMTALGLISEGIGSGPVVGADLFRPVSYGYDMKTGLDFHIATFEITGEELVRGLETGVDELDSSRELFPQVSGMTFAYDSSRPRGSRVLVDTVRVGGKPLRPTDRYTITGNEGLIYALGFMSIAPENIRILDDLEYDVLRAHVMALGTLDSAASGRIRDVAGLRQARRLLASHR